MIVAFARLRGFEAVIPVDVDMVSPNGRWLTYVEC
jgi:hypothetical protein